MPARRLIDAYLEELRAELKLPRRTRERVLAEVADHLHEAAERREGDGDEAVQRAAIETSAHSRLVALRFSEELAVVDARRGALLTAVATAVFCVVVMLIGPWRAHALWPRIRVICRCRPIASPAPGSASSARSGIAASGRSAPGSSAGSCAATRSRWGRCCSAP